MAKEKEKEVKKILGVERVNVSQPLKLSDLGGRLFSETVAEGEKSGRFSDRPTVTKNPIYFCAN